MHDSYRSSHHHHEDVSEASASLDFYLSNEKTSTLPAHVPSSLPQWPPPPHPFHPHQFHNGHRNGFAPRSLPPHGVTPGSFYYNGYGNGYRINHPPPYGLNHRPLMNLPDPRALTVGSRSAPEIHRRDPRMQPPPWPMRPDRLRSNTMPVTGSRPRPPLKPYIDDSRSLRPQRSAEDVLNSMDPLFAMSSLSLSQSPLPSVPLESAAEPIAAEQLMVQGFVRRHYPTMLLTLEERAMVAIFGFLRPLSVDGNCLQMVTEIVLRFCSSTRRRSKEGEQKEGDLVPTSKTTQSVGDDEGEEALSTAMTWFAEQTQIAAEIVAKISRLCVAGKSPEKFASKFTNHAKGNFYISKEMIKEMMRLCAERFDTDVANDEKSAFGYYKESVAMQINDGQIDEVMDTIEGPVIIIHIDLHFARGRHREGEVMYLIAKENDHEYVHKVRWCISDFATAREIYYRFNIESRRLPTSSRRRQCFQDALKRPPTKVPIHVIWNTDFKHLPAKTSKRHSKDGKAITLRKTRIRLDDLKYFVQRSWDDTLVVPVVVIKGKKQWIEWKRFVQLRDGRGQEQWVGISLRYYAANRQWKIECMDYDAGRIYYQHRLVGPTKYRCTFEKLAGRITTSLDIYKRDF